MRFGACFAELGCVQVVANVSVRCDTALVGVYKVGEKSGMRVALVPFKTTGAPPVKAPCAEVA